MRKMLLPLVACSLAAFITANASASVIHPTAGQWNLFDVDEQISDSGDLQWIDAVADEANGYVGDGSSLSFVFSVTKTSLLTIVDGGLAGDVFNISINGENYIGSAVNAASAEYAGLDFDFALNNSAFSKFSLLLAPGDYTVTGNLHQSASDDSFALNTTVGALRVVEAPESNACALLGLSLAGLWAIRRRQLRINC